MIKINKPSALFKADLILRYQGSNQQFLFHRNVLPVRIQEIDYGLNEKLVVSCTMPEGKQVKFSMISSEMYFEDKPDMNDEDNQREFQNHCYFDLFLRDNMMYFIGSISYENYFPPAYRYRESYIATIVTAKNERLLKIWEDYKAESIY